MGEMVFVPHIRENINLQLAEMSHSGSFADLY
jgi:hypothetical protein